jgi:hypothetical protein
VRGSVCVRAWYLAEGDVLPGGERVISVARDPAAHRVTAVTSDGARRTLYRDDWLVVARRASPDATPDPGNAEADMRGGLRGGRTDVLGWLVRTARTRPAAEGTEPGESNE